MPSPEDDQIGLIELELEQAWALMRHHEKAASDNKADFQRVQCSYNRELPRSNAFLRIARDLQSLREKRIAPNLFIEKVEQNIISANREVLMVEEAQARNKKAKGE